jgi:hypothetical protein
MIQGGCRCGEVRYTLPFDEMPRVYCCHCLDCQTWSASAFTQQVIFAEGSLVANGPIVIFDLVRADGAVSRQHVCGVCHTRIFNTNTKRPGIAALRAGTLDRSNEIVPVAHIWVKRKQPWIIVPEDVPQFEENAPPAKFASILIGYEA